MPTTSTTYNTGTQRFDINFPYLRDTHVIVKVSDVEYDINDGYFTIDTAVTPSEVVLGTAVTEGTIVRVFRRSSGKNNNEAALVNFVDGSVLTEEPLDEAYLHNLYLNQESVDSSAEGFKETVGDSTSYDASNKKISNIATPVADSDAATKKYVDDGDTSLRSYVNERVGLSGTNLTGFYKSTHTGNGTVTDYILSFTPQTTDAKAYIVAIDGVLQTPDTAYSIGTSNITFTSAPPNGSSISVVATAAASVASVDNVQVTATGSTQARAIKDRFADVVNVKDFGATGDGTTDDTSSIQAALNTTAKAVYFPEGTYVIQATSETTGDFPLTSTVADRNIYGEGVITANTIIKRAFSITGDRTDISLDCDGNSKICSFIKVEADDCVVHDSRIKNLYAADSTDYNVWAIYFDLDDKTGGAIARDNVIENLENLGTETSSKFTSGITVEANADRSSRVLITDNYIEDIKGTEGDAIKLINNVSSTYYSMPALISNNTIVNFTRRAVKIQANAVAIINNSFENNKTEQGNLQGVVDLVQGDHHVVNNNIFRNCTFCAQIKCSAESGEGSLNNITVSNNIILGIGSETPTGILYFKTGESSSTKGNYLTIQNNFIDAGDYTGNVISAVNAKRVVVSNNHVTQGGGGMSPFAQTNCESVAYLNSLGTGVNPPSLRLSNTDTSVTDGQECGALEFEQNDSANTSTVHAAIKAMFAGTTGLTELQFNCRDNEHKMTLSTGGDLLPAADNTQDLGTSSKRWATASFGTLSANALPTYADDSAASSLTAGQLYKTSTGELRVKL